MLRFILIFFVFLGFAFYELSGGADFNPEETRLSRIETPPVIAERTLETEVADASVAAPAVESVTRIKLDLNTVDDVLRPAPASVRTASVAVRADEAVVETVRLEAAEEVTLPSLIVDAPAITPVDFGSDAAVVVTGDTSKTLRLVTGNRVNVRGGPGTGYSVVNRLVRGDEVEILQDPGDGWVKLRPVGGGPVGWMADFLLSEG